MKEKLRSALEALEHTDESLLELEQMMRILSMGIGQCGDAEMLSDTMIHLAKETQGIRALLDDATTAVIHLQAEAV